MKPIEAIILAGGRGTRLAPLTDNLPKPLVPVLGKPMMSYVLEHLKSAGITRVAVSTAYLGRKIEEEYGDGKGIGMEISYLHEPSPMGTGAWMKFVNWDDLSPRFLVLNADNLFWIDVDAFLRRHTETEAIATMAGVEVPSETATGAELLAVASDKKTITAYVDRKDAESLRQAAPNVFVSSGWYVMSPQVRVHVPEKDIVSMETDIWPSLSKGEGTLGFYHAKEPWFDSGTHERLARVEHFLRQKYGQDS